MKAYCLFIVIAFVGCSNSATKNLDKLNSYDSVWKQADFSTLANLGCTVTEAEPKTVQVSCPDQMNIGDKTNIQKALKEYEAAIESLKAGDISLQDQLVLTSIKTDIIVLSAKFYTVGVLAGDYESLAKALYPNDLVDQKFTSDFFKIFQLHQSNDPFMEGAGPSVPGYSIDEMLFSFVVNDKGRTVDLAIFNWDIDANPGLKEDALLSLYYAKPVYLLENVNKASIGTQDNGAFGNFSYIMGSNYFVAQIRKTAGADFEVPDEIADYKPHPGYIGREHPLRKALDTRSLVMFAPNSKYFYGMIPGYENYPQEEKEKIQSTSFNTQNGGYVNVILGMMIHEAYHAHEGLVGEDRGISENREKLLAELESSAKLRSLMALYARVVFSIADGLIDSEVTSLDQSRLADLRVVIKSIKGESVDAWNYIRSYEYTEGFAEYVSAYSLIKAGIVGLEDKVKYEKEDTGNNFVYRTGTFAGLFLNFKIGKMPFSNGEDRTLSPWEIAMNELSIESSNLSIDQLLEKYSSYEFSDEEEVLRVSEYLRSTVVE